MTIISIVRRHAGTSLVHVTQELESAWSYDFFHNFVGYGFVIAWGVSFYPQLILNWQRKSTEGMSIGFLWYNVLGFTLYLIYTSFTPDSTLQDRIFAAHALLITICTLAQVPLYGRKLGDFPPVHGRIVGAILLSLDLALVLNVAKVISVMDLLYTCGYLKDVISLVKYTPQLFLNFQRRSTAGFAMGMVFLDLMGGILSLLQQFIDCKYDPVTSTVREEWTWEPLSGNKPKLFLGLIAIVYDILFMWQHFVMYGPSCAAGGSDEVHQSSVPLQGERAQLQRPTPLKSSPGEQAVTVKADPST